MSYTINEQNIKNEIELCILKNSNNKFIKNIHKSIGYDQVNEKLLLIINSILEHEDIDDIIDEMIKICFHDLNINLDEIACFFKDDIDYFVDRIMHKSSQRYLLKTDINSSINFNFVVNNHELKKMVEYLDLKNDSRNFAIKLQDMPPNILNAEQFCNLTQQRLSQYENLTIKILNQSELKQENLNLLLAVNQGSVNEARLMIVEYIGDPTSRNKYALVGKGITFDSGGYALKNWKAMQMMKFDMSGAAISIMSLEAIAKLKPKTNIVAIACLTDNLIDGGALVADSVVKSYNGLTVEIENTDCEGRLVLGDGVSYAIRKYHANKIITVATLTGAVAKAIGTEFTGGFTNNQQFYNQLVQATKLSKEKIWQLPLTRINKLNQQHSDIADIWNEAPSSNGGASNGAGFINFFTEDNPFIHLDIASTSGFDKKHGSGVMLSTLVDFFSKVL